MKSLLTVILLLIAALSHGQDYRCIDTGRTRYFTNQYGYLRGIRIDSVRSGPGYQTLFPYKTARGRIYDSAFHFTDTLDPNGGSWMGGRIIVRQNGDWLFDNFLKDTIVVKTRAGVGTSWRFYDDSDAKHYDASVIAIDTMTISGTTDSVKRIRLFCRDSSGNAIASDSLHHRDILLSKHHGFARLPDLYLFPYHDKGSDSGRYQLDYYLFKVRASAYDFTPLFFQLLDTFYYPTFGQLYDLHPVDVIVRYSYGDDGGFNYDDGSYKQDSFISRYEIGTVRYFGVKHSNYTRHSYTYPNFIRHPPFTDTIQIETTDLFPDVTPGRVFGTGYRTRYLPEEYPNGGTYYYQRAIPGNCGYGNGHSVRSGSLSGNIYWHPFELNYGGIGVYEGLGLQGFYNQYGGNHSEYETHVVYSYKNGIACGSFDPGQLPTLSVAEEAENTVRLFPNPARDVLRIDGLEGTVSVQAFNSLGQQVCERHCTPAQTAVQIPVSGWTKGVYYFRLTGEKHTICRTVIVE